MMLASLNMLCVPRIYDAHMTYTGSALVAPQVCRRVCEISLNFLGEANATKPLIGESQYHQFLVKMEMVHDC